MRAADALHEPPEYVAQRRLACLVSEIARHDAVFDDAAHAFDAHELVAEEEVPVARPHDHHERARGGDGRRRHRGVKVDVSDRDRRALAQSRPFSGAPAQAACP